MVYASTLHKLPCNIKVEGKNEKATLTEDDLNVYAEGAGFSYVFSKHYGVFTSIKVNGEEQLAGNPKLSAFRAPTDNDVHMKTLWANVNIWQGENIDTAFNKIYECELLDGGVITQEEFDTKKKQLLGL